MTVIICIMDCHASAETKHALLIGISDYGNTDEDPHKWVNINGGTPVRGRSPYR